MSEMFTEQPQVEEEDEDENTPEDPESDELAAYKMPEQDYSQDELNEWGFEKQPSPDELCVDENDELHELKRLCKVLKRRAKQNLDVVWAIIGSEGTGKTHLALQAARLISKDFSFENNVLAYPTIEEVRKKANTLHKYSPIVLDEAIKTFYKRNAMSSGNKQLNQFFAMCRKLNLIWILCIPRFSDLDPFFRESRVCIVAGIPSVQDTGTAIVFDRDDNLFGTTGWYWKESFDMNRYTPTKKIQRLTRLTRNHRLSLYERTPNYMCTIHYPFDKKLDKEYKKFLKSKQPTGMFGDIDPHFASEKDSILAYRVEKSIETMARLGLEVEEIAKSLDMTSPEVKAVIKQKKISPQDLKSAREVRGYLEDEEKNPPEDGIVLGKKREWEEKPATARLDFD